MYTPASPKPATMRSADAVRTSLAPNAKARFASDVTIAPAAITRESGTRSVSGSTTSTAIAYPSRYAETTHPSSAADADHSARSSGSAAAGSCDGRSTIPSVAESASARPFTRSWCGKTSRDSAASRSAAQVRADIHIDIERMCYRKRRRCYWLRNKTRWADRKLSWLERQRAWLRELKAGKTCTDCGGSFPPEAMQWDQLPGMIKLG